MHYTINNRKCQPILWFKLVAKKQNCGAFLIDKIRLMRYNYYVCL